MSAKVRASLSTKSAIAFSLVVAITTTIIMLAVRHTVNIQFKEQYNQSVASALDNARRALQENQRSIQNQLIILAEKLSNDYAFRLALFQKNLTSSDIVNFSVSYMPTMNLDALLLLDDQGEALSLGHFRNGYGQNFPGFLQQIKEEPKNICFSVFESPAEELVCLASVVSVQINQKFYHLVGGVRLNSNFLQTLLSDTTQTFEISLPTGLNRQAKTRIFRSRKTAIDLQGSTSGELRFPFFSENESGAATATLYHPRTALEKLLGELNRMLFLIASAGIILAILFSGWITQTVTTPLIRLTQTAAALSLEKLDSRFEANSADEVGVLGATLNRMLTRLKRNKLEISVAEKKAAFAQIARQVNHDIKNGFLPIRNVMRHFEQVSKSEPQQMAGIFEERKGSIFDSISYLEKLARNYSRLKPETNVQTVDLTKLLRKLQNNYVYVGSNVKISAAIENNLSTRADPLQLQRALENIIINALEAIGPFGEIRLTTSKTENHIKIEITDSGMGIPKDLLPHIFQPHISGKKNSAGLGLANVKAIIDDLDGKITVESETGKGATFVIVLPAV